MSSNNGIYILKSKDGYRVSHAQAIENLYWWHLEDTRWEQRKEINPYYLWLYFSKSFFFKNKTYAYHYAEELYNDIINDDFCPIVEYGICEIEYNDYFPDTRPNCCENPSIISKSGDLIDGSREQCYNCGEEWND